MEEAVTAAVHDIVPRRIKFVQLDDELRENLTSLLRKKKMPVTAIRLALQAQGFGDQSKAKQQQVAADLASHAIASWASSDVGKGSGQDGGSSSNKRKRDDQSDSEEEHGDVKWRVDISSTRKASMREYPRRPTRRIGRMFRPTRLAGLDSHKHYGVDYKIHWCEQDESWRQTRCDDLDKWRYVERYIKPRAKESA